MRQACLSFLYKENNIWKDLKFLSYFNFVFVLLLNLACLNNTIIAGVILMVKKKCIKIRLSEERFHQLNEIVSLTSLSREEYLRNLITGTVPKERPSEDFLEIIQQLRSIGNNLNQLTMIAHKIGSIDIVRYKKDIVELNKNILEIREKVLLPEEKNN